MLLSKEIAVSLNLAGCKLKQYTSNMLRKQKIQLTPEQFLLIDLLWNMGPMSQQQLADNMRKDKNSITKLVDALERKGLITRQKDLKDRRSNTIVPTAAGEAMKMDTKEKGISMLDKMLDGITEKDLRVFLNTLNRLLDNMDAQC